MGRQDSETPSVTAVSADVVHSLREWSSVWENLSAVEGGETTRGASGPQRLPHLSLPVAAKLLVQPLEFFVAREVDHDFAAAAAAFFHFHRSAERRPQCLL